MTALLASVAVIGALITAPFLMADAATPAATQAAASK